MSLDLGINPISFRFGLFHNVDCRPYWCKPFHDHYLLAYETDPFVQINVTLQHWNARDQTSFSMFAQGFNSIFPPFVYNVEWSLKVTRDQQIYGRGWPMLLPNLFFSKDLMKLLYGIRIQSPSESKTNRKKTACHKCFCTLKMNRSPWKHSLARRFLKGIEFFISVSYG